MSVCRDRPRMDQVDRRRGDRAYEVIRSESMTGPEKMFRKRSTGKVRKRPWGGEDSKPRLYPEGLDEWRDRAQKAEDRTEGAGGGRTRTGATRNAGAAGPASGGLGVAEGTRGNVGASWVGRAARAGGRPGRPPVVPTDVPRSGVPQHVATGIVHPGRATGASRLPRRRSRSASTWPSASSAARGAGSSSPRTPSSTGAPGRSRLPTAPCACVTRWCSGSSISARARSGGRTRTSRWRSGTCPAWERSRRRQPPSGQRPEREAVSVPVTR